MADVTELPAGSACQLAAEGRSFHAYNQEGFRYLLALEQQRAERSRRPLLVVLTSVRATPRRIHAALAPKIFAGLWLATRETDFIGWYRDGQIAGAVLTQRGEVTSAEVSREIRSRVSDVLSEVVPRWARERLRVRVCQLNPKSANNMTVSRRDWASGL